MLILLGDDNSFAVNLLRLREDPKMTVEVVRKGPHFSLLIEVTAI